MVFSIVKEILRLVFLKSIVMNLVSLPTYENLAHLLLGSLLQSKLWF
jgi:hypothetical protein